MKTAIVVCPGRGTYNKAELGYLGRHFQGADWLAEFDTVRKEAGQDGLTDLDGAERYSLARHGRGDNASGLIFAATYGDFLAINREAYQIVGITGNSMGWYSALACGGALSPVDGFRVANTMGRYMQEALIGGQLVYPWVDDDWVPRPVRRAMLLEVVTEIDRRPDHALTLSIDLGGMLVLAGNEAGLAAFDSAVDPVDGRFPMRLANHAGFHSALQRPVAERGRAALPTSPFGQPTVPLIDGRGEIWWPGATDPHALWDYTLGAQVTEPYDFTRAITIAAREFAPDLFIVTGPGTTLGGAIAQSLILGGWRGLTNRQSFKRHQDNRPVLLSMGMDDQRRLAT